MEIDKAFVRALQSGDEGAWERLYNEALAPLRGQIAAKYCSLSSVEVDDVWAHVIETVYTKIGTLRKPDALGAWLWTIAQNTAKNYFRRSGCVSLDVHHDDVIATTTDDDLTTPAILEEAQRALALASPPHAAVLLAKSEELPESVIYFLTGLTPSQQWGTIGGLRQKRQTVL